MLRNGLELAQLLEYFFSAPALCWIFSSLLPFMCRSETLAVCFDTLAVKHHGKTRTDDSKGHSQPVKIERLAEVEMVRSLNSLGILAYYFAFKDGNFKCERKECVSGTARCVTNNVETRTASSVI